MTNYTTIYFPEGIYQINKVALKEIINRHGLIWNEAKVKDLSWIEIVNIFTIFKTEDRILQNEIVKNKNGASGIWENTIGSLKVVIFNGSDLSDLPVLMVYRGIEEQFYKEFIVCCIKLGCEIGRLIEDENGIQCVFKKQLSKQAISKEASKEILIELFDTRLRVLDKMGYKFSSHFIELWKENIEKFGY